MKLALASNHDKLSESGINVQNKDRFSEGTWMTFIKKKNINLFVLFRMLQKMGRKFQGGKLFAHDKFRKAF